MSLEEVERERFDLLAALFQFGDGQQMRLVSEDDLATKLGKEAFPEIRHIALSLVEEGLVHSDFTSPRKCLTTAGLMAYRRGWEHWLESHRGYVGPTVAVNAPFSGSLQVARDNANQQATVHLTAGESAEVRNLMEVLRAFAEELGADGKTALDPEISTIDAQLAKSKPNRTIIATALSEIWSFGKSAGAGVTARAVWEKWPEIQAAIERLLGT